MLVRSPVIPESSKRLVDCSTGSSTKHLVPPDGTLYHVFDHPQVWSDGFNGAPPFLAATGHYDEALKQIDGFRRRLWDPQKKLLAHIWDDTPTRTTPETIGVAEMAGPRPDSPA